MGGILKFFLNAIKAIFIGPFYVIYFCFYLILAVLNHFAGELKVLFTGFHYGSKNHNKYTQKVQYNIKKGGGK